MDETARLEARVWSRIMGERLEFSPQSSEISAFLGAEYAALDLYRSLQRRYPREAACLLRLAKEQIKCLRAEYFVETGRVFCEKSPNTAEYLCGREAIRRRLLFLKERDAKNPNYAAQNRILLDILTKLV